MPHQALRAASDPDSSGCDGIRQFNQWYQGKKKKSKINSNKGAQFFISEKDVQEFFGRRHQDRTRNILEHLSPHKAQQVNLDRLHKKYSKALAILILIGQGKYFFEYSSSPDLVDDKLPFDGDDEPRSFPRADTGSFYEAFQREQWQFCALRVEPGYWSWKEDDPRLIPVTSMQEIAHGTAGKLFKVKIHRDYNGILGVRGP